MPRSPLLLLPALALMAALPVHAQIGEIGITGGATYYIGDLNTHHYPARTKPMGGLLYRYNFDTRYAVRAQVLYGRLEAYDSDSPDTVQQTRGLHFRSDIFEAAVLAEVNFFNYRGTGKDGVKWTPFLFGGIAYFHVNPQARLNDTWYDLQPLGTEGQGNPATGAGEPYKNDQICLPFGAGLKANLGRIDIQLEWGMRRTFTDHIDDVSGTYADPELLNPVAAELSDPSEHRLDGTNVGRARGDTKTSDWYNYTGLSITLLLSKFTECDELYFRMKH
ncbi:MAG: hypothetical protein H6597_00940 [Flavobacteriales bacterium]|nr:hypothetical protein [Flavobacteriales bacterium]MCB9193071.1 hypothetical protein [Flavobacteriales bacterium]